MDLLDLSACTTNKEVSEAIIASVKSYKLEDLIKVLSKDFVYHEEATRKIYAALAIGDNSILYGPGGFGKSVLVKALCEELGLPVIYKVGYEGMKPEELLGVPNMTALLEESEYITAFEKSVFAQPGILILEEFFDADPSTAAALKDILTEKGFREKSGKKESLISSVIICGNKTPDEVSTNDSTKAFYKERFPFRHKMAWTSFDESDYMNFFRVYFKTTYNNNRELLLLVAKLCSGTNTTVSPRIAAKAAKVALELGPGFLDTVEDIDTSLVKEMKREAEIEAVRYEETALLGKIASMAKQLVDEARNPDNDSDLIYIKLGGIKDVLTDSTTWSGEHLPEVYNLISMIDASRGYIEARRLEGFDVVDIQKLILDEIHGKKPS